MTAMVKEFSTGSLGWYLNGKSHRQGGQKRRSPCKNRHEPDDHAARRGALPGKPAAE